jgi:hypothetical protein
MIAKKKIIKFKEGEMVLVLRKADSREKGWNNVWDMEMDLCVGRELRVLADDGEYGVRLEDGRFNFDYPRHVLKRVKLILKKGGKKK